MATATYAIRLSRARLEKLKQAAEGGNVEEFKNMLTQFERKQDIPPNDFYNQLFEEFVTLELASISRQEASTKYGIPSRTIKDWESRGAIRVFQKAKRRGMPTTISERDVAALAGVIKKFRIGRGGPIPGFQPPVRQLAS